MVTRNLSSVFYGRHIVDRPRAIPPRKAQSSFQKSRLFKFVMSPWPVPGSKIAGFGKLRKRKHENNYKGGNCGKEGLPFPRSRAHNYFRVHFTYASSLLSKSLEQARITYDLFDLTVLKIGHCLITDRFLTREWAFP